MFDEQIVVAFASNAAAACDPPFSKLNRTVVGSAYVRVNRAEN